MCAKKRGSIEDLAVVGIDIGKDTFHLVGFDQSGQLVIRKQIKRLALNATFEQLPRCIVGMEACLSAHFVSRTLRGMGFEPRIIPAIYVKPFNKGQKNDYNDAEAIAEAALRPNLRTVSEKDQDQLDLQALEGNAQLTWLDAEKTEWTDAVEISGGNKLTLSAPGEGGWVALISM